MAKRPNNRLLPALLIPFMLLCSLPAAAGEAIDRLQQEFDAFAAGPDHRFAPLTTSQAQALLGAAMLAEQQGNEAESAAAIEQARGKLDEARHNAARFRQQFGEPIALIKTASDIVARLPAPDPLKEPNPQQQLQQANDALDNAIKAAESGELNRAQQSAQKARDTGDRIIEESLPWVIDKTEETISRAAGAGAKNYAPRTFEKAKSELIKLQRYVDGIARERPARPLYALTLAEAARDLATQVKQWRRENGSHEALVLESREHRFELARRLGMEVDTGDAHADVTYEQLAARIDELTAALDRERRQRKLEHEQMTDEFKTELTAKLADQRQSLLSEKDAQLSNIKEAFRAKLEKETFEQKRQEQVRKLFKKGEVEILANLDGSLLLRLSSLKFSPGSSKIDPASFDMLGRLKATLEIYGERKVRIEGHTDNKGDVKANQKLSLKRAEAVRDFLIAAGAGGGRLKALGYGEVRPIASNEFAKGRAMNRRIDIVIEAK